MNTLYIFSFTQKPFWTLVDHNFKPFETQWNHYKTELLPKTGTFREMANLFQQTPKKYIGIALVWEPFVGALSTQNDGQKTCSYSQNIQMLLDHFVDVTLSKPSTLLPKTYKIDLDSPICSPDGKNEFYSDAIIESHESGETLLIFRGTPWADPTKPDTEVIHERHEALLDRIADNTKAFKFAEVYYRADITSLGEDVDHNQARWKLLYELSKWSHFDENLLEELFQGSALHHPAWEMIGKDGLTLTRRTIKKILSDRQIFHKNEIEGFLKFHYSCRHNEILGKPEILKGDVYEEITDFEFNSMLRHVTNKGGKITSQYLKQLLTSNLVEQYDPFREYFQSLPAWNEANDPDFIDELAEQVQTSNQDYWKWCLKKWLVGAVATALHPKKTNQQVLALCGGQGKGKTMFLESLVPKRLESYYYSGPIDPANKDSLSYLTECFLINLDELDSLNRGKEAALKELITKSTIKYRRPYGTFNQNYRRVASFMGSVNHEGILSDTSGSRRYLVHQIQSINYQHNLDMDLVYSQAYALYKQGFEYWFAGNDIQRIHSENKQYELSTVEEEMLMKEFSPGKVGDATTQKLSATEILKQVHEGKLPTNSTSAVIKLGQALTKQGFEYQMIKGSKKWLVCPNWELSAKRGDLWGGKYGK